MQTKQRGFTLIELLVVIAIIGLLSSVILASLSSARTKGCVASAQETMHTIQVAAAACLGDGTAITVPSELIDGGGGLVCTTGTAHYVSLPANWTYCDGTAGCTTASTTAATTGGSNSFYIVAASAVANDNHVIACSESSCTLY